MDPDVDWWSALLSLISAAIGAAAAIAATWWSLKRAAHLASTAQQQRERDALTALQFEMDVAHQIATGGSAAELPTVLLTAAASAMGALDPTTKHEIVAYAEAVHRYNGRAHRIVLFGAAKRARGEDPGIEKVGSEHSGPVIASATKAKSALARLPG